MKLLTKALKEKLRRSRIYSKVDVENPKIIVKFFTPWSNWTWYVIEGQQCSNGGGRGTDYLFFGLVEGFETELGYFRLSELESLEGPGGLKVERDLYFGDKTLNDVRK